LFFSPAGEPFRPTPGGEPPLVRWFAGADANVDGSLSPEEFADDHARYFKVLDANGDGRVDGPEVDRYERTLAPEILSAVDRGVAGPASGARPAGAGRRGRGGRGSGGPVGVGRVGAARYSLINEPQPIRAADLDLDYRVSVEE
jgi:hypothetical protein